MLILNSKFSLKRPALFMVSYFSGALDFHGISQPAFSSYAFIRHSFHSATDEPLSQGSFSVLFLLNTFFVMTNLIFFPISGKTLERPMKDIALLKTNSPG